MRFQPAGHFTISIALHRVLMGVILRQLAEKNGGEIGLCVTIVVMYVNCHFPFRTNQLAFAGRFFQSAKELFRLLITGIRVLMLFCFRADQNFLTVAGGIMGMRPLCLITLLGMDVSIPLRKLANQLSVCIKAGSVVAMNQIVRLQALQFARSCVTLRGDDTIVLAGADDPNGTTEWADVEAMTASLRARYGDTFWLLLAHRNNLFSQYYCRLGADLTFSGHGHGGIWRLPFTDGLISPLREWFPSWTDGFYTCTEGDCDNAAVFVSRGLGNSPRVPRLFNRPEVAVVTLHTAP